VVLGGCFRLHAASTEELKIRLRAGAKRRWDAQPLGLPSAGCIFKNPPGESAGALIDKSGLKGLRIGDAQISEKHANWIINLGKARAGEILSLMELVEERVFDRFGVRLEREVRVLGGEET
jgi:UDP-N-acetylmuramate dehydrogenase